MRLAPLNVQPPLGKTRLNPAAVRAGLLDVFVATDTRSRGRGLSRSTTGTVTDAGGIAGPGRTPTEAVSTYDTFGSTSSGINSASATVITLLRVNATPSSGTARLFAGTYGGASGVGFRVSPTPRVYQGIANFTAGGSTNTPTTGIDLTVGETYVLAVTINAVTLALKFYVNGVLAGTATGGTAYNAGTAPMRHGSISATLPAAPVTIHASALFNRDLTPAEIFRYGYKPAHFWQLLEESPHGSFRAPASHTLTAAATTQDAGSGTGAITQTHVLTAATTTQDATSGTGALVQTHELAAATTTQDASSGTGEVSRVLTLAGDGVTQDATSSTGAIEVAFNLGAAATTQDAASSTGAISQVHVLVAAPSVQDNIASASAIVQAHILAASPCTQDAQSAYFVPPLPVGRPGPRLALGSRPRAGSEARRSNSQRSTR